MGLDIDLLSIIVETIQSISVKTGSGEMGVIEIPLHHRNSRRDWQRRYLTTECQSCPFFVPPTELPKIIPILKSSKIMRIAIPDEIQGVCMVGQEQTYYTLNYPPTPLGKYPIHKFLVNNPHHPIQECKNPSKEKRVFRAIERRIGGKLGLVS